MAATDPIHPIMLYLDNEWQEFSYSMYENDIVYRKKLMQAALKFRMKRALQSKVKKVYCLMFGGYIQQHTLESTCVGF